MRHTALRMAKQFLGLAIVTLFITTLAQAQPYTLNGTLEVADVRSTRIVSKVDVSLYEASTLTPVLLGTAETDQSGNFSISVGKDFTDSIFFVTAEIRPRVRYMAILGQELPGNIVVNELTTVASAYSMAQFLRSGDIVGDALRLQIAAMMSANIADVTTGEISDVLLTPPNADQTNSLRLTRTLGNLVNHCTRNAYVTSAFLRQTRDRGQRAPGDVVEALANLARDPARNADRIYRFATVREPYTPALEEEPINWSICIKINDTGDPTKLFGGPANVSWDSRGYAFVTNNSIQGTPNSGRFNVALQPDGKPSDGLNGNPPSILEGGGILGGGWGVCVDEQDRVWMSNFGWGQDKDLYYPSRTPVTGSMNGSISLFANDGTLLGPDNGYFGPFRAQGVEDDALGNIWIASLGLDEPAGLNGIWVFKNGDPTDQTFQLTADGSGPFGIAPVPGGGAAWVSLGGGLAGQNPSSLKKYELDADGNVVEVFSVSIGKALKIVTVDQSGNVWLASQGTSEVYAFSPEGIQLGAFDGGGVNGPWGLCVDGEGNIWVANFGPLEVGSNFTDTRVSKLCGANPGAWPRGLTMGDGISPDTGYTLPSAGEPVTLANGDPLYGPGAAPSYAPLQRSTSVQIDRAGNLWYINNWKPDFNSDAFGRPLAGQQANPGGDGIVIWVGLAPPPVNVH
ncbi:MAG: hypothetical protein ACQKBV_04335 [Puniceicoccales bacterium]